MTDLTTTTELRRAIRAGKTILAQVRFGCSEHWVRITKTEALAFIDDLAGATPHELELERLGETSADGATVWLG